jgi:ornithine--oxo-acid transaminase
MAIKPLELIGAGQGWGAKFHEVQMGPHALHDYGLLQSLQKIDPAIQWQEERFISPSITYPTNRELNYPERLAQVKEFSENLSKEVIEVQSSHFPVILGGDHTIAIGTWSALTTALHAQGNFGLIWVDAHMDSHTPKTSHTQNIHGMPLAALLGYGEEVLVNVASNGAKLHPQHVVLIGVRSFEPEEAEFLRKLNVRIYFMSEVQRRGFEEIFQEAVQIVSQHTKGFGVSIDIDAFDPEIAPGTGAHAIGGILHKTDVTNSLKSISQNPKFKALEIAEFDPSRDIQHKTTILVQELVSSVINRTQQWIDFENKWCANNYNSIPVVLSKAKAEWLWDIEGKRYVDMMAAYSAVSLGHAHPRLIHALQDQAQTLAVVSRAFHSDKLAPFLERLCQVTGMDKALPMNTGVEAVETALKAARRYGYEKKGIPDGKAEIIVAKNNFHGRTIAVVGFSSEPAYQKHFGPFAPGFVEIPFGDSEALKKAITPNTCAFLIEPIQGEAGIIIPGHGWLKTCQEICNQQNVLLIVDEVQTGLGRTGKMFAIEHDNVKPDAIILGKALGGGLLPVSMFLARLEVMDVFTPASHGSTFGGNPLGARIGLEVLNIIQEENLVERSRVLGDELLQGLKQIKSRLIKDVRGKGLFIAVEINPQFLMAREVCEKLMQNGVLSKETHDTVIRFAPPLIISKEALNIAIEQFAKTIAFFEHTT